MFILFYSVLIVQTMRTISTYDPQTKIASYTKSPQTVLLLPELMLPQIDGTVLKYKLRSWITHMGSSPKAGIFFKFMFQQN